MDELRVGLIAPIQNYQKQRDGSRRPSSTKRTAREKRKKRSDQRERVPDGIVVTISHSATQR